MEHHHFIDGQNKEGLILPNILEISTKIWITKNGGCIVANNNSKIPERELREILETIQNSYFLIIAKWKRHFPNKEIKYYC